MGCQNGRTDAAVHRAYGRDHKRSVQPGGYDACQWELGWDGAVVGCSKQENRRSCSPDIRKGSQPYRYSPDGATLASGSRDNNVRLWDAVTGAHKGTLTGHTKGVTTVSLSPDNRMLASGSRDGTVRLWDVKTSEQTHAVHRAYSRGHKRSRSVLMARRLPVGVGMGRCGCGMSKWENPKQVFTEYVGWADTVAFRS